MSAALLFFVSFAGKRKT